jgi:uncharacterized protein (DUF58 family)
MEKKLNTDIAGAVSELEVLVKRVLPKNIVYRLVLGRGLEFDGYRAFMQDEDSENIDWKASTRGNKLLARKYIEERDLKFFFIVDVSDNMVFGSTEKLKCEYAAELCSAASHLILETGDSVGFSLINDKIIQFRKSEMGKRQFEIFSSELINPQNYGGVSDLNKVLENLIPTLDRSVSMIFLVSDFTRVDESYKKNLELLGGMFETVALIIRDPLDNNLPDINKEIVLESPVNKQKLVINPHLAKNAYGRNAKQQLEDTKKMFENFGIDILELMTNENSSIKFAEFLSERIEGGRVVKNKNVH